MRREALAVILCAAAGGGCRNLDGPDNPIARLFDRTPTPSGSAVARSLAPTVPAEGLAVDSVLIERPVGDEALDRDLWKTDAAAVPPEVAALHAENGLRVAVVRGTPPPVLQRLLAAEPDLVNSHRLTFAARRDAVIPTAGPVDPCEYAVLTDLAGRRSPVSVRQAQCGLSVRPEAAADGRVRLVCEPEVQHGERREWLRPTADATSFVLEGEVPTVRHPALGFTVVLGPNDYLLVGWSAEVGSSLGSVMFAAEADGRPRQRVLVVRAGRLGDPAPDLPAIRGLHGRPAIAAEAGKR
jgi:hypothetical protein